VSGETLSPVGAQQKLPLAAFFVGFLLGKDLTGGNSDDLLDFLEGVKYSMPLYEP
jgi:hypothetical protein